MANGTGVGPWNSGEDLSLARYPHLIYGDRYLLIYDFLRTEAEVRAGLAQMEAATRNMGQAAFRAWLAAQEQRFGFEPTLGIIRQDDDIVKASLFWLFLARRQAIVDIGAGDADHGVLIHRVQWVLIGQWNETRNLLLGPVDGIGELYRNLGGSNARLITARAKQGMANGWKLDTGAKGMGRIFESVWDDVLDAFPPRQNGTVPEYLRAYIEARHGGLYARMRW